MKVASADSAAPPQIFLALDFGARRTGVASGNTLTGSATPLHTIEASGAALLTRLDAIVAEWRPDGIVVGVPFHPDGNAHVNTARARKFACAVRARYGLDVHEVDERYSTVEAARLRPKRQGLDDRAAAVILEQFLAQPR